MIKKNLIKLVSLVSLFLLTFSFSTINVSATTKSTSITKDKNFIKISRIYSSQSSQNEKIAFINSKLESNSSSISTTTINEFALCQAIDKKNGILPNQIGSKVGQYIQRIKELSKKDSTSLQSMGITPNRIQAIRIASSELLNTDAKNNISTSSLTPSEILELSLSSATCTLFKSLDGYFYDQSYDGNKFKTQVYVTTGWKWNQSPLIGITDGFANAWSSATNLQLYKTFDGASYYDEDTDNYIEDTDYSSNAFNNRAGQLNGESFNFDMSTMYNSDGNRLYYEYAKSGYSMNILVSTDFYVGSLSYNSEYTHSLSPISPSISIGVGGGISLSYTYSVTSSQVQNTYFIQKSDYNPNY